MRPKGGDAMTNDQFIDMKMLKESFHRQMHACAVEILQSGDGIDGLSIDQLRSADSACRGYNVDMAINQARDEQRQAAVRFKYVDLFPSDSRKRVAKEISKLIMGKWAESKHKGESE